MNEKTPLPALGHEATDAPVGAIAVGAVAVAVGLVAILALCVGLFRVFSGLRTEAPANPMAATAPRFPPEPRLELTPGLDYQQLRAEEDRVLSTYGWVDRKAGRIRIPVDRALELQLERGFPVRKEAPKQ